MDWNTGCVVDYSRTPLLRPPSESDWSGRKTGVVIHERLDYFIITCGLRHMHNYILTVSSTLRTSFGVHCRTRENAATYPLQHLQARRRSPCLAQNSVGMRWTWINLPNISISGLIKPRSENIVQIFGSHIYVACLTATFVLFPSRPIEYIFAYEKNTHMFTTCQKIKAKLYRVV